MRVSCGNARTRPSAATRSSCARVRPEKKRAWPRTRAASTGFSLFSNNLPELRELVFLHEHGVLGSGVAAGQHRFQVIAAVPLLGLALVWGDLLCSSGLNCGTGGI